MVAGGRATRCGRLGAAHGARRRGTRSDPTYASPCRPRCTLRRAARRRHRTADRQRRCGGNRRRGRGGLNVETLSMSPLTKQRLASFPNADAIAHSPLRSGAVPRQWSPLAPFCARRAAFFWRRSEFCVWRGLAWIFLRRESDILGMGVIPGSRHRSKMDRDDRDGKQEALSRLAAPEYCGPKIRETEAAFSERIRIGREDRRT